MFSFIVGYIFKLSFTHGTVKLIYVPEYAVFNSESFKKQEKNERMTARSPEDREGPDENLFSSILPCLPLLLCSSS